jgi:hypothetical protein
MYVGIRVAIFQLTIRQFLSVILHHSMVSHDGQQSSLPWLLCCFDLSNRVIDNINDWENDPGDHCTRVLTLRAQFEAL